MGIVENLSPPLMPGLFWKIPVLLLVAAPVVAATLTFHARPASPQPAQPLPAALRAPPDGLVAARNAAARATETAALRKAIEAFHATEGRPPANLAELAQANPFTYSLVKPDLHRFRYDPDTMAVIWIER
jgi:hypothetical protein